MEDNRKTILVIDDSPTVRRLIELILNDEGYRVLTAEDGEQGVRVARTKNPSLILVDFLMPKMNGYEFCKTIRSDHRFKEIPIILITAKGEDVGHTFEEKFGIIEYFHKPFEPDELAQRVNELMRKTSSEDTADEIVLEEADEEIVLEEADEEMFLRTSHAEVVPDSSQDNVIQEETVEEIVVEEAEQEIRPQSAPSPFSLAAIEKSLEQIMEKYFKIELQLLLKNILIDTIREMEMVKRENLVFSGQVAHISMPDVLQFLDNAKLTGKLSVLTPSLYSDVYVENGHVVFANVSKKGLQKFFTDLIVEDGKISKAELVKVLELSKEKKLPTGRILVEQGFITEDQLMRYLRKLTEDSFYTIVGADSGSFYFEKCSLPWNLSDIKFRLPMAGLLLDGLRRFDEQKVAAELFSDDSVVLSRMITNADEIDNVELHEKELAVFAQIDGKKTLREIIQRSKIDELDVKRICYSLQKVGLLKIKDKGRRK